MKKNLASVVFSLSKFVKNFRGFWNSSSRKFLNLTVGDFKPKQIALIVGWLLEVSYYAEDDFRVQVRKSHKSSLFCLYSRFLEQVFTYLYKVILLGCYKVIIMLKVLVLMYNL